jgi:hypothetical protein
VLIRHVFIVCIGLIALNISVGAEASANSPNAIESNPARMDLEDRGAPCPGFTLE